MTNTASGNITGGNYGIIATTGSVNVTNSGSITGTAAFVSAAISAGADATVINNAGASITGDTYGIRANAGSANVTNSGSITAPGGNGISAGTNAMVINNAGASITGGFVEFSPVAPILRSSMPAPSAALTPRSSSSTAGLRSSMPAPSAAILRRSGLQTPATR